MQDTDDATADPTSEGADKKVDQLRALLSGPSGLDILANTNYEGLQTKILTLLQIILRKNEIGMEDKVIIENSLSLWIGIVLY